VTGASLVSIGATSTSPGIPTGLTDTFKATGVFSDNSTLDLTSSVTWSSSVTAVATIGNSSGSKGVATAVATGLSPSAIAIDPTGSYVYVTNDGD